MKKNILPIVSLIVLTGIQLCSAQPQHRRGDNPNPSAAKPDKADSVSAPIVTHHSITVDGKVINYTATAGYMPIKDKDSATKVMAKIFYIAYTADNAGDAKKRPVTFTFNGGPGSSSIWLHMGAISPVRVNFGDDKGDAPAPPYTYSDNPYSWIGFTDLVFIDPVSTGYSQALQAV